MSARGFPEGGQGHVLSLIQRFEKGLERSEIWMIGHVAGIEHLHGERAPGVFVGAELGGVEFIVEETSFTSNQVRMKIIGLKAIHDCGAFADTAVLELQNRDAGSGVLVRRKDFALGFGVITCDFYDVIAHAQQQSVQGVTTRRQEGAAAGILSRIPSELAIPRTDAVVIIDLAIDRKSTRLN